MAGPVLLWALRACDRSVNAFNPISQPSPSSLQFKRLWPEEFAWLSPPYEYEDTLIPIDILTGSDDLRLALQETINSDIVSQLAQLDTSTWWDEVHDCLLY
jgi:hypothetical protein